jgi:hypothetical protein
MSRVQVCLAAHLLLIAAFAVTSEAVWAGDPAATAAIDPSGTWKWDVTFNDNASQLAVKLKWDGKDLTGKYTAFDQTTDIAEGKLDKDELSFIAHPEFNGNTFDIHFNGKVEGDDINGKVTLDFGQGPQEFDWHPKRVVDADSVLGTWQLRIETPTATIEPKITITQDDRGLHGAYSSRFGEREAKNLAFKDGELTWEISGEREGNSFKVVYRGKLTGDSIKGTNEYDFGGNTGSAEFTGKRMPAEEQKTVEVKPASAAPAEAEQK